ncbi:hypothetical protein LB523_11155 [Mesorhizobium sp. ESP-6-4]|uniref:hypothetical protein n=1 Tax=Mesorhizobium sp. ESP-6-4 TaxID=2876624 RepID=UPI001CCA7496|nr:hypothetical protein [Mesorhizobium sp. ESP-6-4]MBZ9659604.1 hypothetical protein [Mesorhizobium sp. ESP-6-4]
MNQFLAILSDVMLIATFQWRDTSRHPGWCEERPGSSMRQWPTGILSVAAGHEGKGRCVRGRKDTSIA